MPPWNERRAICSVLIAKVLLWGEPTTLPYAALDCLSKPLACLLACHCHFSKHHHCHRRRAVFPLLGLSFAPSFSACSEESACSIPTTGPLEHHPCQPPLSSRVGLGVSVARCLCPTVKYPPWYQHHWLKSTASVHLPQCRLYLLNVAVQGFRQEAFPAFSRPTHASMCSSTEPGLSSGAKKN